MCYMALHGVLVWLALAFFDHGSAVIPEMCGGLHARITSGPGRFSTATSSMFRPKRMWRLSGKALGIFITDGFQVVPAHGVARGDSKGGLGSLQTRPASGGAWLKARL